MISSLVVSRDKIRQQTSKSNIKKGLANKEENIIALLHKPMLHMNYEYYLQFHSLYLRKDMVKLEGTQISLLL